MIGKIIKLEDDSYDGKDFKKVTLDNGNILKVKYGREGYLKNKWGELEVGTTYSWTMGEYNNKPFVRDFEAIDPDDLPEESPTPTPEPAPQAVGMMTKEIGDMIRSKYLIPIFGDECAAELITWYRSQTLGITRVPFDGAKLPNFHKAVTKESKPKE